MLLLKAQSVNKKCRLISKNICKHLLNFELYLQNITQYSQELSLQLLWQVAEGRHFQPVDIANLLSQ